MNRKLKWKLAQILNQNPEWNRKVLSMKHSWDEVEGMLNKETKKKKSYCSHRDCCTKQKNNKI